MALLELESIVCISNVYVELFVVFKKLPAKTVKLMLVKGKLIIKLRGGTKSTVTSQIGRGTFR